MRRLRTFVVLATSALVGGLAIACSSDGDVGAGGTCFLVTDCKEGLFCLRPDGSDNGTCSSDLKNIQPPADATLADTSPTPAPDAMPEKGDGAPADSPSGSDSATTDSSTGDEPAPSRDTGALPMDSGIPDTAPADTGPAATG